MKSAADRDHADTPTVIRQMQTPTIQSPVAVVTPLTYR